MKTIFISLLVTTLLPPAYLPEFSSGVVLDTCRNTATLEAFVDQFYDTLAYKWYFEDEVIPQTSAAIEVQEPGEYIVEISAVLNGYVQVTQQTFLVPEVLEIETVDIYPASCDRANGSLQITVNHEAGVLYSVDGITFQEENSFENLVPGTYTLTVQNRFDCVDTQRVEIGTGSLPVIEKITSFPAGCGAADGSIRYELSGGTGRITASLGTGALPSGNTFRDLAQGIYTITFLDEAGCELRSSIVIPGTRCPVYIPNAFSPNGDGVNDLFRIAAGPELSASIRTYRIFDRWGKQLYTDRDFPIHSPDRWWDGTFRNRRAVAGTYIYFIEIEFDDGAVEVLQGTIDLLH